MMQQQVPATAAKSSRSKYLGGPVFDGVFLVGAPVACLLLLWVFWNADIVAPNARHSFSSFYLNTMLTGHLLLTFLRSHANKSVFRQFRGHFTIAPALMYLAMATLTPFRLVMAVVLSVWGHWHAWQQTFGLARIYDAKAGNAPTEGRTLDFWLCVAMWMGPLLSGGRYFGEATLLGSDVAPLHPGLGQSLPAMAALWSPMITRLTLVASVGFLAWYLYSYYLLSKRGYRVSGLKIALIICTGVAQVVGHGLDPEGQGRFITVVFHYWQYFAIMWVLEGPALTRSLRLNEVPGGRALAAIVFLAVPLAGGIGLSGLPLQGPWGLSAVMLLSFLHFWYDGFMWSVRKKMV
jgi:hypothetical protein